jgi:hypothetical protein
MGELSSSYIPIRFLTVDDRLSDGSSRQRVSSIMRIHTSLTELRPLVVLDNVSVSWLDELWILY